MTKKHYEAIAAIFASTYNNAKLYTCPNYKDTAKERCETLEITASRLADYFANDNKNFDRQRFLAACKIKQSCDCNKNYGNKDLQGAHDVNCNSRNNKSQT